MNPQDKSSCLISWDIEQTRIGEITSESLKSVTDAQLVIQSILFSWVTSISFSLMSDIYFTFI